MKPLVSLVSGTYNRLPLLERMVNSFRVNIPVGMDYEIILVDGGSTDGTIEWALSQPDVQLIQQGELVGAIRAFTEGANQATGKYTLLANDDIVFQDGSIIPAVVHLENSLKCGAVAFQDNRPIPGYTTSADYHVLRAPAERNGALDYIIYAQVGLFRTWLGHKIGWWMGVNGEMSQARTYGGDNFLSAKIWELGYTVDEVPGCRVDDYVYEDGLREINRGITGDSEVYYGQWTSTYNGPIIPPLLQAAQEDARQVRILYAPIYEPGYPHQKAQKRGLRDALKRGVQKGSPFLVWELDYMAEDDLETRLMDILHQFQPHILLTQVQAPSPFTAKIAHRVRMEFPYVTWINWNGDEGINGLIGGQMLEFLRHVDLQLIVNMAAMPLYEQRGIRAAYWQVAYEDVPEPLPDMPIHDVVWLASLYNPQRQAVAEVVREFGGAIYQPGIPPETIYYFDRGRALYRNAKIGIGTNEYPESPGFVSNRLFEGMAAGGCLFFQQTVKDLQKLTHIIPGTHFVEWRTPEDLRGLLRYFLDPAHEDERQQIAEAGTRFVRHFHSFDARVRELFELMRGRLTVDRQTEETVKLEYIGKRQDSFGAGNGQVSGKHYEYQPGYPLIVDKRDAPFFLQHVETWKVSE